MNEQAPKGLPELSEEQSSGYALPCAQHQLWMDFYELYQHNPLEIEGTTFKTADGKKWSVTIDPSDRRFVLTTSDQVVNIFYSDKIKPNTAEACITKGDVRRSREALKVLKSGFPKGLNDLSAIHKLREETGLSAEI